MVIEHEFLTFDTDKAYFTVQVDDVSITRYLKGVYRENKSRFNERFTKFFLSRLEAYELQEYNSIIQNIQYMWDYVSPFSYKEAFELGEAQFRALVFSSIDIREMINELGSERICVEGKELINKTWNPIKNEFENISYSVIYELHHVNGDKLGITSGEKLPVIKCWCTSTNEEHWLWVDNIFSDPSSSPLDAIASTCVIYKSMKGKINHIIRQGDVFLFEMNEDVVPSENEELLTLPMNEYFSLLKSQS